MNTQSNRLLKSIRVPNEPIIRTLMDIDKYKFSMLNSFLFRFPNATARYGFNCRTPGVDLTPMIGSIREQINHVGDLRFQESELRYLSKEPHLHPNFIDWLSDFKLNPKHVHINAGMGGVEIYTEGPILKGSPWETYILTLVSEIYYRYTVPEPDYDEGRRRLMEKINFIKSQDDIADFKFSDFGTRRRFSREWHEEVVRTLKTAVPEHFVGTSNYHLAREYGLTPMGTMAHEYLQAWQGIVHPLDAQKVALNEWADVFRGCLGDALTDVIGVDAFCKDLDLYLAKLFDGFRHDSGDPELWCQKILARLRELKVDPKTKRATWSDGLDVPKAVHLHKMFRDEINTGFGIGTNLTNDLGYKVLSIVMKLITINDRPTAKLSDSPGKTMCADQNFINYLANSYGRLQEFSK